MRALREQMCAQHHISIIGWVDRGPNWYNHSCGQCEEVMGVGDRECALMRAQTCAQHHTYSIGGQTAGLIGAHIGTNTNWDNGQKLWGSAIGIGARRAGPIEPQIGSKTNLENGHKLWGSAPAIGARERSRSARVQGWNRASQRPRARSMRVGRA
jgi:hypothetical protein